MAQEAQPQAAPQQADQQDQHEAPVNDLITVDRGQIAQALKSPLAGPSAANAVGSALHLNATQISALVGGASDLQLTKEQYANLHTSITQLYRQSQTKGSEKSGETTDVAGSLCGSSASPTPTAAPKKTVPSVTGTNTHVTETSAGTKTKEEKVGSGTVTVRTDVKGTFGGSADHLFALTYKGSDSKDAHWLQFIHREILGIHADGTAHAQTGNITTTGGTYKLTTGGTATTNGAPGKDNYNTDTASATDPFYEAGGLNNRSADSTTMYDLPGPADARVQAAFAAGATRVISRAHFDTFLVNTDHVVYHVKIDVVYDFSSAAATPAPVSSMPSAGAAAGLPATIQEKFHAQFPSFNFIK